MGILKTTKIACTVVAIMLCGACASSSVNHAASSTAEDFADENLDVMFATEFPVASKDEALAKAAHAYREGEVNKAQFYLVRALKFDVTDVNLLAQIGDLHILQGNNVLAARAYNFALQNDPTHAKSLEGLGLLYFRTGNDSKARELLEAAVDDGAKLWRAYNALGVIADRERNFELALSYYGAALEIQPRADSVLINRGYSKYLSKDYRDAALDFYEVATRSDTPKAWRNLAMVYARQGWYDAALKSLLEVTDASDAHNEIGSIAMQNGDARDALHHFNEAIRLSPTYFASAEENLAELLKSRSLGRPY